MSAALALRQVDPLQQLDDEVQALLASSWTHATRGAGFSLVEERDSCDRLHLLVQGWAYRYTTTRDGARQILAVLVPGDFCNLDVLTLRRPDYGIRALTPITVASLPAEQAGTLAEQHPAFLRLILRSIAVESAMLSRWTLCLGRKAAQARLAHLFCELAIRIDAAPCGPGCTFELPLTQEQISDVLGLTPVHVNRTLQALRASRLVNMQGRSVTIPDLAALSRVADFDPAYLHRGEGEGAEG